MKRFTFLSITVCLFFCAHVSGQTVVDIGWDWDGDAEVEPVSGIYISSMENVIYPSTENEVYVIGVGDTEVQNADGGLYVDKRVKEYEFFNIISTDNTGYVEYTLTDESADKKISEIKINGTSSATDRNASPAVLFSDRFPFDESRVIGYEEVELAVVREGDAGVVLQAPDRTKSYRIYRKVQLDDLGDGIYEVNTFGDLYIGSAGSNARIGYLSATLVEDDEPGDPSSIDNVNGNDKVIVGYEYFDVTGRRVSGDSKGIVIVKVVYEDGSVKIEKVLNR